MTAEFAVLLPAVTALLALLLLGSGAGILQLRLEEGARAGARALARGESTAQAAEIARAHSGSTGAVSVDLAGGYATVVVTGRMSGPLSSIVPWQQSAKASARLESQLPDPAAGPQPGPAAEVAAAIGSNEPVPAATGPAAAEFLALALSEPERTGWQAAPPRKSALWRWARTPHTASDEAETAWTGGSRDCCADSSGTYRCRPDTSGKHSSDTAAFGTNRDGGPHGVG